MKAALIQQAPVLLDRDGTMSAAVDALQRAAGQGAGLAVFTEALIPGYPAWIWRLRPGGDWAWSEELHALLLDSAVDLSRGDLLPLQQAAARHHVSVVCGINEIDHISATLYNTVVVIGPDGSLLNRHRKLMPTNPERMVWGLGDATGLRVVDTPAGRIGTLICWENYMPLARYALYGGGVEIYIAPTYDSGDDWLETLRTSPARGAAGCWAAAIF